MSSRTGSATPTEIRPVPEVLDRCLFLHSKWRANQTAVVCAGDALTWSQAERLGNRVANGLIANGVKKGDCVGFMMANRVEAVPIILGIQKCGAVLVPVSAMLAADAVATIVKDAQLRVLFVDENALSIVKNVPLGDAALITTGFAKSGLVSYDDITGTAAETPCGVPVHPDDDFNVIYSSGTTGTPKGVVHSHRGRFIWASLKSIDDATGAFSVNLVTTPLYHNGSLMFLCKTVLSGGLMVLMKKFDPKDFMEAVQKHRCTHTFLVPAQIRRILDDPDFKKYDLSSLRILTVAGAPLDVGTKERIGSEIGDVLTESYGVTEGASTTLKSRFMRDKLGSVGKPTIPGVDFRVISEDGVDMPAGETGEVVGTSPWIMSRYHNQPELTAESIWLDETGHTYFRTGDLGRLDADGFLYIVGRKKDMIISGGINIYAADIEAVLNKHPGVKEAAVIGIPDERWGETPVAIVIPNPGAKEHEVREWVNAKVAKYQRVSRVEFRDDFPRNEPGKILKRVLREEFWPKETV